MEWNWLENVSTDRKLKAPKAENTGLIRQVWYLLTEGDFPDLEHENEEIWNIWNMAPLG